MTVHRWERSQRSISEENLDLVCDLYDRPLRWFLTLEEGDLWQEEVGAVGEAPRIPQSAAATRLSRKIADAPSSQRPIIEKVVEDLLDSMEQSVSRR